MGRIGLGTERTYPHTERTGTAGPGMERTGFRPLYMVPILYLASLYACPILIMAFDLEIVNYDTGDSSGLLLLQIPVVLAIANIVAATVGRRTESRAFLLNSAVLLKYGLVPFFLLGGLLVALAALSSLIPVPFMIFVGRRTRSPTSRPRAARARFPQRSLRSARCSNSSLWLTSSTSWCSHGAKAAGARRRWPSPS